jgi:biopolymer transport protein ExbD
MAFPVRDTPAPTSEMNVTPMLDVLLVLLIIFIAMCIQVWPTLYTQLPQPCTGACEGVTAIVLEVLPGREYRVNRTPVTGQTLLPRLRAIYADRPDKSIQVAGHEGTTYQDVIDAMDVARSAGVTVIGISPKPTRLEGR